MGRSQKVVKARDILQEAQDRGLISFRRVLDRYRSSDDHWVVAPDRATCQELTVRYPTWTVWEVYQAFAPERKRDEEAQ